MPELPEVETIKLGLQKKIVGLKLNKIQVLSPKSFLGNPNKAERQKIVKVWRRAKLLGIDLGSYLKAEDRRLTTLLFHLKMTGQLIYDDGQRLIGGHPTSDMRDQMPNSHTRVIFGLSNGSHLYFNDQRRFGWVKIVNRKSLIVNRLLGKLGPEPLEKGFSWQVLKNNLLRRKTQPVKVAIMDQTVVAGVGNIYASEACFDAKIDPRKKIFELCDEEFKSLHKGIIRSLKDGIKHGGSTRAHFVDAQGHKGYFLDYANVYGKSGYKCKSCQSEIKKIQLGNRGTYLCPHCQR